MLRGGSHDHFQHAIAIAQHIGIPESKNAIPLRLKPTIAFGVAKVLGVLPTIDFDDQTPLVANEVDDETSDRNLATEAQPGLPVRAQRGPETKLGIGHAASQRLRARTMKSGNRPVRRLSTPLPDRFAVRPPPQGGR
jgi:hypothetical protein